MPPRFARHAGLTDVSIPDLGKSYIMVTRVYANKNRTLSAKSSRFPAALERCTLCRAGTFRGDRTSDQLERRQNYPNELWAAEADLGAPPAK